MRLSPKALTRTRTSPALGVGLGVAALMKRALAGPLPPLMSVARVSRAGRRRTRVMIIRRRYERREAVMCKRASKGKMRVTGIEFTVPTAFMVLPILKLFAYLGKR